MPIIVDALILIHKGFYHKTGAILLHSLAIDRTVFNSPDIYASSGDITRVSGQRPEQGVDAKFFATQKTWAQGPYPAR